MAVQFLQYHLLKRLSFPCVMALIFLPKIIWTYVQRFISGLYSVSLICMSVCILVPHQHTFRLIGYCSFGRFWNKQVWVLQDCSSFFKVVLILWSLFRFRMTFEMGSSVSAKMSVPVLIGIIEFVDCLG